MIVIALAALLSLSTALAIDDTTPPNAPTVTDDAANRPNAFRSGNTLYFNNSLAGSLILSASATDPEPSSGISHYNFSNPTPATNWTSGTLWSVALATTCSEDSGRTWGDNVSSGGCRSDNSGGPFTMNVPLPIYPGDTYTINGIFKRDAVTTRYVDIYWLNSASTVIGSVVAHWVPTTAYANYTVTAVAPAGATQVRFVRTAYVFQQSFSVVDNSAAQMSGTPIWSTLLLNSCTDVGPNLGTASWGASIGRGGCYTGSSGSRTTNVPLSLTVGRSYRINARFSGDLPTRWIEAYWIDSSNQQIGSAIVRWIPNTFYNKFANYAVVNSAPNGAAGIQLVRTQWLWQMGFSVELLPDTAPAVDNHFYTWYPAAVSATSDISATDNVSLTGPATTINLTPDATPPTVAFSAPANGGPAGQSVTTYLVTFSAADGESGADAANGRWWRTQRQVASASGGGVCGTFANDAAAGSSASGGGAWPVSVAQSGLASAKCYRWTVLATDNVGNLSALTTSGTIVVDTSAPAAPNVVGSGTGVYQSAANATIFFRPAAVATLSLTSTGTDNDSGIASSTFGALSVTTGWTYTGGSVAGNPAVATAAFDASALGTGLGVTTTNKAGLTSTARNLSLTVDSTAPAVYVSVEGGAQTQTSVTVTYTTSDLGGTGFGAAGAGWSLQRHRSVYSAGLCNSFVNDTTAGNLVTGNVAVTAAQSVQGGLLTDYCYRWVLAGSDNVGNTNSSTSAQVRIGTAVPAPTVDFTNPAADYLTSVSTGFETVASTAGWPGTRAFVDGNWEMQLGGITVAYYSPKFAAAPGDKWRVGVRGFSGGPNSYFALCFFNASDSQLSCPNILAGDQMGIVSYLLATAPANTAKVGIKFYHAYYTSHYDDVLLERETGSDDDYVQIADSETVAWTETIPAGGNPVADRSLQRYTASAAKRADCVVQQFTTDGAPVTGASPVTSASLQSGHCYYWTETVDDGFGNGSTSRSGMTYVVDRDIDVRVTPSVRIGQNTSVAAVIIDRDGEPDDSFTGTLTISTDDAAAVFPNGTSYTLDGPNDQTGHTFAVLFGTAGVHTVTVRALNAEIGTATVSVATGSLTAAAPVTVYAGVPFPLTVNALTAAEVVDAAYSGTVTFSSSDSTATYSRTTGSPPTFTFACNCRHGEVFGTRLSTLGVQTITATDQFGRSANATVTVVAAPSGAPSPVSRIDQVKWRHGDAVDWYITAVNGAAPFTILEVTNSCDQPSSGMNKTSDPGTSSFVQFTSQVPKPICDDIYLSDISHTLVVIDGAGHSWTIAPTNEWLRFASVPYAGNFTMIDPGDPLADMATVSRPGGTSLQYGPDGRRWTYGDRSLELQFYAYEAATVTELYIGRPGITGYVQPWNSPERRQLPVGLSTANFDDITHTCYIGGSLQNASSGWLRYTSHNGRTGAFASGGGILAGPGTPTVDCGTPTSGGPGNPRDDWLNWLNPENWPLIGDVGRFLAADPVDPFTGGFTQQATDFSLGGLSPSLAMTRTYRGDRAEKAAIGDPNAVGIFGAGWGSNLDQRLIIRDGGAEVDWRTADGGISPFTRKPDGSYSGLSGAYTLSTITGGYQVMGTSGASLVFDANGRLSAFKDPNGRSMTLAYDGNGQLDSVTDAANRTADVTTDGAGRVTRVDLPDGRYVAFTYSTDGYLATTRDLSGETLTYITDTRGRITQIRDAAAHVLLRNTYDDRGRVIAQANNAGHTTYFSYAPDGRMTRVSDPLGAVTTDCFIQSGQISDRIDALGFVTSWTYDANGNAASTTDALGNQTKYVYDDQGQVTKVTDPLGRSTTLAYAAGKMTLVTGSDGGTIAVSYDGNGRPATVTRATAASDPNPQSLVIATYTYDAAGFPTTIADAGGFSSTTTFDSRGYPISLADPMGRTTTLTVDARGLVTGSVDPLGNATGGVPADHTSSFTYDDMGRVLTSTNQLGQTTTYTYDSFGRPLTVTSPLGSVAAYVYNLDGQLLSTTVQLNATETATTTYEYDDAGQLAAVIDAEDRRTEYDYDAIGQLVLVRDADDQETTIDYDGLGRPVEQTDATGRSNRTEYDAAGRVTKAWDSADQATTYTYNALDQLTAITDPLDHTTTYAYDWLGRRTSATNAADETTSYTYDDAGRLTSVTDNDDHTTSFEYNADSQLTTVTDAASGESTLEYDAAGRLITRTNARGQSEHFEYDALGQPTRTVDADGKAWVSAYDDDGRLSYTIDAEGQQTDFTIDRAGRVLEISPASPTSPIGFEYDDTGRLLSMSDGNGTSSYTYDPVGRLTGVTRGGRTVGYAYDPAGRITGVTYPGGNDAVTYAYDSAGRLATLTDWADRTHTYTYDGASRVIGVSSPGNLDTSVSYDEVDRLTGLDYVRNSTPVLSLGYTYDPAGNVATYTDDSGTATFGYDALNRLTSANYPGSSDFTYAYDPAGNLTELVGPSGTLARTYSDGDRLLTEDDGTTTRTFTYDDNGNLLDNGAGVTYTYDTLGRLVAVSASGLAASYTLDGAGNRLVATINSSTTTYDLDYRGLATVLSDGNRRFLPGAPSAGFEVSGTWHNGLTNAQGTLLGDVDTAGTVSTLNHFDPFGSLLSGGATATGPGYTGEWTDATGLINLRARAYDPTIQRFPGRDTFGGVLSAPTTWNRFAYGNDNPLTFADPSGHFALARMGLSAGLQSTFFFGDLYSGATGLFGFDWIGGYELSAVERGLAVAAAIVPVMPSAGILARIADRLGAITDRVRSLAVERNLARLFGGGARLERTAARFEGEVARAAGQLERIGAPLGDAMAASRNAHRRVGSNDGFLFRGIGEGHPGFDDALRGVARPRGGFSSALLHNLGDTRSPFTSWTTDADVARRFAGERGLLLRIPNGPGGGYRMVPSPDLFGESEILIEGTVRGAEVLR